MLWRISSRQQRVLCISGLVCLLAVLGLAVRLAQATEYRLQVTSLEYLTFSRTTKKGGKK